MLLNKLSFVSASNSSCFEQGVIQLGLTTYCCIFVARVVHDLMFFRLRLNSINMIAQYPNLLPSRSLLVRTCIVPTVFWHNHSQWSFCSSLPVRHWHYTKAMCHAAALDENSLLPCICTYTHMLDQWKPTDRISSCIQGSIRTMRQKLHHLRTRLDMRVKNCISHTSCMTFKSGFFFGVGVDKWCSWWKYAEVCFVLSNFMHAPCQVWATIQAIHEWVYKSRMSFLALAITWSYWSFKQHMTYLMFGCEKNTAVAYDSREHDWCSPLSCYHLFQISLGRSYNARLRADDC